jgi:hypothetical protein
MPVDPGGIQDSRWQHGIIDKPAGSPQPDSSIREYHSPELCNCADLESVTGEDGLYPDKKTPAGAGVTEDQHRCTHIELQKPDQL